MQHIYNQKYRNYIQPQNQNVFNVLDSRLQRLIPDWTSLKILDFGCNNGHLLGTSNGRLNPANVYGVDIHKPSLFIARRKYPTGNWIHYDGFNSTFNPGGEPKATFKLPEKVSVAIAYGVFTHMDLNDIKHNLDRIRACVHPGGWIIFSAWEDRDIPGYLSFLKHSFKIEPELDLQPYDRSMYLINRERILYDVNELDVKDADWVETFYKREFLCSELGATYLRGNKTLHQIYGIQVEAN